MALIECRALSLGYGAKAIVEGLSFSVSAGDYLLIVGENGAGKSTLMRTLLGLQKPLSGSIVFGDGLRENEIGYLPQQTAAQRDFPATVWEIAVSGCQSRAGLRPFYSSEEKRRAEESLRRVGLTAFKRRCFRELSGGQQRRALLARALCATGRLLLMDEPVAGLDPTAMEEMYAQVRRLHEEGTAIVMISHDVGAALKDADHILHIDGDRTFFGTAEEYAQSAEGKRFLWKKGGDAA